MQVPEGWEKLSFGEVVSIKTKKFNPKKETMVLPCIELEHIDQETGRLLGSIPSAQISSMKSMFNRGDVLFGKLRPYLKKFAQPNFDGVCSTEIWVLKNNKQIEKSYLFYLIQTNRFLYEANKSTGSKMPRADWEIVEQHVICLPPLPEQTKIAEILSTWDNAITTTEQLLANSQQQKKALMQQLLTGKKRLLDDNGQRFSGEWEATLLKEISKIAKGKALSSRNLVEGNYPVIAGGKTSPYNHNAFTHENIITVSASGAYAGFVAYHRDKIWASDCSVISNIESSDIGFIFYWLSYNQNRIYSLQSGGAQPHVYPRDLAGLKVLHPPLKEQQKIAAVLAAADDEIRVLEQKLDHLKQEKKALMQQLLTGKKRVKITREE